MSLKSSIFAALILAAQMWLVTSNHAASPSASEILGNPDYPAICYGGYRTTTRDVVPTVEQIKEDLRILSALGFKFLRTYNTQQFAHAANLLEAIEQMRESDPKFQMYVMLGAWIDCRGAWSGEVDHESESLENNRAEIETAVRLAKKYPETVKVISVGNEAMVHWAASYFVRPDVILGWVEHLQELKAKGEISNQIWITSSDNFASWGGGDTSYHTEDLTRLIRAVDYVSMHTYPFHDTHYNAKYWIEDDLANEESTTATQLADAAMERAVDYARQQYTDTATYIESLGIKKTIHIGETGWATQSNSLYGPGGSGAADEYKAKRYWEGMNRWTREAGITCFYFEAFDECWKDAKNPGGSENHFGLINLKGQAKYALWAEFDRGTFRGLTRGDNPVTKTYGGDEQSLTQSILPLPSRGAGDTFTVTNESRPTGELVTERTLVVTPQDAGASLPVDTTYPSSPLRLNIWDGTCGAELGEDQAILISPGPGAWWGCGLEIRAQGAGENLSNFADGELRFEIRSATRSTFAIGFQTGVYSKGNQKSCFAEFGPTAEYRVTQQWKRYSLSIHAIGQQADLREVTSMIYLRGDSRADEHPIEIRSISYHRD